MERSSHVISRLTEEKREVLRELNDLESKKQLIQDEIDEKQTLIAAMDTVLLHFDEDYETEKIKAKRTYKKRFANGELKTKIYTVLKKTKETPISTREIAEFAFETDDLSRDQCKNIGRSLRKMSEVVNIAKGSNEALWVLKRYAAADKSEEKPTLTLLRQRQ